MNTFNYTLGVIDTLRSGWYTTPSSYYCNRSVFEQQSYRHSAIIEIKQYLIDHKDQNPTDAVQDFRDMMDLASCESKVGTTKNFMFSVYYDVATDVLDVLLCNTVNKERRQKNEGNEKNGS